MFYANICPDTGRAFVCQRGMDNNIAEAFAWCGRSAAENAEVLSRALNAVGLTHQLAVEVTAIDATTKQARVLEISADYHGLVVSPKDSEESFVLDVNKDALAIYHSSADGDITGDRIAEIVLK